MSRRMVVAATVGTPLIVLFLSLVSLLRALSDPILERDLATLVRPLSARGDIPVGEIGPGLEAGQTFVATEPNLNRIDVRLATYQRQNHAAVILVLRRYPTGPTVRTVAAYPEAIRDNRFHRFRFPPIADSAGLRFFLSLFSPGSRPGDAFAVWMGRCDCYRGGTAFVNRQPLADHDVAMRVGYEVQIDGDLNEVLNRASQYKPTFLKSPTLVAAALLFIALALTGVGSVIRSVADG